MPISISALICLLTAPPTRYGDDQEQARAPHAHFCPNPNLFTEIPYNLRCVHSRIVTRLHLHTCLPLPFLYLSIRMILLDNGLIYVAIAIRKIYSWRAILGSPQFSATKPTCRGLTAPGIMVATLMPSSTAVTFFRVVRPGYPFCDSFQEWLAG
jgi:hypothetical protein